MLEVGSWMLAGWLVGAGLMGSWLPALVAIIIEPLAGKSGCALSFCRRRGVCTGGQVGFVVVGLLPAACLPALMALIIGSLPINSGWSVGTVAGGAMAGLLAGAVADWWVG